jgi:integrase
MDLVRQACRVRHFSHRTEDAYCHWIRQFIAASRLRHPRDMGATEVEAFLTSLATERHVSASTQNRALSALLFLYGVVLARPLPQLPNIIRVRTPPRLPVVLSRSEVKTLLNNLHDTPRLVAALLYGSGMRLLECLSLRIKDVDIERLQITRDGDRRHGFIFTSRSSSAR